MQTPIIKSLLLLIVSTVLFNCASKKGIEQETNGKEALLGSKWLLVSMNEVPIPNLPMEQTPFLQFAKEKVSGNAGCNQISGNIKLNGNRLSMTGLVSTEMACPQLQTETEFIGLLHRVRQYRIEENILVLLADDNTVLLRLRKQ